MFATYLQVTIQILHMDHAAGPHPTKSLLLQELTHTLTDHITAQDLTENGAPTSQDHAPRGARSPHDNQTAPEPPQSVSHHATILRTVIYDSSLNCVSKTYVLMLKLVVYIVTTMDDSISSQTVDRRRLHGVCETAFLSFIIRLHNPLCTV